MRRTSSYFAVVAALCWAGSGCAAEPGPESTWSLEAEPDTVLLEFEGIADPATGTMTLRFPGASALGEVAAARDSLTEVTIVKDGVSGSGPADTAETVTVASGTRAAGSAECGTIPGGAPNCFFGDVDLRHFFATRHLSNAYAQITEITAGFEGYGGATSTTLGLDASRGLWRYGTLEPNAAGFTNFASQRRWRFRQPTNTAFTFKGKVFATLHSPGGPNAPGIASLDDQGRKVAADSFLGCITNDGRFTVFSTTAALVTADTNSRSDIYRYDSTNGNITLVSLRSTGVVSTTGDATTPCLSDDGNLVVFASTATDMVAGDTNGVSDVFVRNVSTATTFAGSANASGNIPGFCVPTAPLANPASGVGSQRPVISGDGNFIAFDSTCARLCGQGTATASAANIAAGCINGRPHVYRKQITGGAVGAITAASAANGSSGNTTLAGAGESISNVNRNVSIRPAISQDGSHVAFESNALNLVTGDTRLRDVFVRVVGTTTTARISRDSVEANSPSISGDDQTVVFASTGAQGLADASTGSDVYRFVTAGTLTGGPSPAGTLTLVSVNTAGAQTAAASSVAPSTSADGCRTVFRSNGGFDGATGLNAIFLRDACSGSGTTRLISKNGEGAAAVGNAALISRNGTWTTFETSSTILSADGATAFDTSNVDVYYVRN